MRAYYYAPLRPQASAFIWGKRYQDIDTGKFMRDKMEKIESYSLGDIIDDTVHNNMGYSHLHQFRSPDEFREVEKPATIYNFPPAKQKKDEFEEDERRDSEKAIRDEIEYQKQVKATEELLALEREQLQPYYGASPHLVRVVTLHIKRNTWVPK